MLPLPLAKSRSRALKLLAADYEIEWISGYREISHPFPLLWHPVDCCPCAGNGCIEPKSAQLFKNRSSCYYRYWGYSIDFCLKVVKNLKHIGIQLGRSVVLIVQRCNCLIY